MAAYFNGQHHPQRVLLPRTGFVAILNDTVIGYIAGHLTERFDCQGELQYLYVVPAHRRSGVARDLFLCLATWFDEHHALRVCVNVDGTLAEPELAALRQLQRTLDLSPDQIRSAHARVYAERLLCAAEDSSLTDREVAALTSLRAELGNIGWAP